ncbi:hypothetical protein [Synechococcus phage S-N03]|uniref:Uncharacterized protein n=1 Tax=Synechococcus phage S-N03 TaxID=2718943 RepID=A0A6G8R5J2_9CAUD|nr:hypothetical protein PQC09_gp016 [Synechococcus phage S-N03]QIN96651.1 hypothetical protein [Synechococcus phage S-N03]
MSFSMSGSDAFNFNRFDAFEKALLEGKEKECDKCGDDCDCERCKEKKKDKKDDKKSSKPAFLPKEDDEEDKEEGEATEGGEAMSEAVAPMVASAMKALGGLAKGTAKVAGKAAKGAGEAAGSLAKGAAKGAKTLGAEMVKQQKDAVEGEKEEVEEGYESKKRGEVLSALNKKKGDFKKRYGKDAADVMYAVADKTAKKKGDTSKSDDRYAYEEVQHDVEEGYKPTNFEKNERQAYKHRKAEEDAVRKGDEEAANKHMKRRTALSSPLAKRTELINQGKGPANEMTRKSKLTKESLEAIGIFTEEEIEVILERLDEMPAGDVGHEIHKKAMKANQSAIDAANKRIEKMGIQYPTGEKKKTSVAIRKEKEAAEKKEKAARSKSMKEAYSDMYMEVYKGKHGQDDKEYADSRSEGGKMISGDSKQSGAEYTHGRRVKAANPGMQPDVGGKTKPKSQGKMDKGTRADLEYRKANLKKEEVELEEGLFGKKMTDEEKAAKKRAKAADELERLHKHIKNPLSDINTSKGLRKKMKEELEESGIFSEAEIEALLERNAEVEAQGKKIAELEKEGRAKGLTDKFRQEHPGSREEKKERGAKKSVGDVQADQRMFRNKLQSKYGRTEKQKKEASIMDKHTSPRD